jgi:hypothetical protein
MEAGTEPRGPLSMEAALLSILGTWQKAFRPKDPCRHFRMSALTEAEGPGYGGSGFVDFSFAVGHFYRAEV